MSERIKKAIIAAATDVLVTGLLVFAGIGMKSAGCPDWALYTWVLVTGFLCAYGAAEMGMRVLCSNYD